jgi:toxin ParE1/3/4
MAYRVDLTPRAVSDIEEAFQYVDRTAPGRSNRWLLGLMNTVSSLKDLPARAPVAPESRDFGKEIRQALYGKQTGAYDIMFRIYREGTNEGVVRVLCVRHSTQDPLQLEDLDE